MRTFAFLMLCLNLVLPGLSQQRAVTATAAPPRVDSVHNVDPGNMYFRIYAVVPLVGSGKEGDQKRPMFVPAKLNSDRSGIIAYQMLLTDDHNSAIVEFVAVNRAALLPIINSTASGVAVFERGKAAQADIENVFQAFKKGFTFDSWIPVRPQ